MAKTKDPLLRLVIGAVPRDLLLHFSQRIDALYEEAWSHCKSGHWYEPQAKSVRPAARRAIMDAELRRSAERFGLRAFDRSHDGNGLEYVLVRCGAVNITCHHADGPRQAPRPAKSRKQNAAVNRWVVDGHLPGALCAPLPGLGDERTHVYLLHGEECGEKDSEERFVNRFFTVAIPTDDGEKLIRAWPVSEILAAYEILTDRAESELAVSDKAQPRLKPLKKKKDDVG